MNVFPLGFPWDTADPFLFCVYHLDHYPNGNADLGPDASLAGRTLGDDFTLKEGWRMYHGHTVPGFPSHPHRGFETITIVTRGYCDHSDSLGAAARFGQGDVQWMTAGRGVQHSEMFPLLNPEAPNTLELFQIWLNLPRANKLVEPHFKMLWADTIPRISGPGSEVQLVAGTLDGVSAPSPPPDSWAADPAHDVMVALVSLGPGAVIDIPETATGSHRRVFVFEGGGISAEEQQVETGQGVALPERAVKIRCGAEASRFLWLQGKPISEPVAKYGPFVMNDPQEINRALEEYRLTQFGGWPWPHPDHVHPREKGRFALYPDGSLIEK